MINTQSMHGETISSVTDSFTPPSELIAQGIAIDCPGAGVCTIADRAGQAKAERAFRAPTPIANFGIFSGPCTLKRQLADLVAIKRLSLGRRAGKQAERKYHTHARQSSPLVAHCLHSILRTGH